MTSAKNVALVVAAKVSKYAAKKACGATSFWGCCQPKEPEMLKIAVKK